MKNRNSYNSNLIISRKGDKERRVYFDAKAKIHLEAYLDSRRDKSPALFVTLDSPHTRLKISGVEIRLRELGRRLGVSRIHPHKFRRTMATRTIDKGNDVNLDSRQIYFVNQIVEYIVHNGLMKDLAVLQEPPFTDMGSVVEIFTDLSVWMGVRRIIDQVNANAVA